jgi:hypothetical protein
MELLLVLIKGITLASLLAIFYQDQKERRVFLWLLLGILCLLAVLHIASVGWLQFGISLLFNLVITLVLLSVLAAYIKLRMPTASFLEVFGLGDVLFIIGLALGFSTLSFVTLLVFGLLFSLVLHWVWLAMFSRLPDGEAGKRASTLSSTDDQLATTVPLAGYLALFFAGVLVVHWLGFYENLYLV